MRLVRTDFRLKTPNFQPSIGWTGAQGLGRGMDGQTDRWVAGWMDVWNFTPMFYRTLALLGRYPKRLTKFFGRSSNAKNALPTRT